MNTKEEIDILVEENIKLVNYMIKRNYGKYLNRINELGLYEDFYQEGCVGLFKAAKVFDPSKGFKFSTLGAKWVDFSLRKFLSRYIPKHYKNNTVSIDKNMSNDGDEEITILNIIPIYDEYKIDLYDITELAKKSKIKHIEVIVDLHLLGFNQVEIGKKIGLTQSIVSRKIKRLKEEYEIYESLESLIRINKVS